MPEPRSRRNFLKMLGLGAAAPLAIGSLGTAFAANVASRKNIILILTDQQRDIQWFPEGWEQENLPAMTFLKQHGISFTQAVNNTCACTPSRTTIFTGKYPTTNLSNFTLTEFYQPTSKTATPYNIPEDNNTNVPTAGPYPLGLSYDENQLDQTLPNLATVLAAAGYETFYKGKYHLSKGVLGYDNNSYEPDITRYGFAQWDPPDAGQDAQIQNYGGGNADNDGRFTKDTIAFLKERVAHPGRHKKPFCLIYSLVNPHDVLGYPTNWVSTTNNGGYRPRDLRGIIDLPPTLHENLRKNYKPSSQQNWLDLMGSLHGPQRKNYLNFYGNLMKHVDRQIMSVLDVLTSPNGRSLWEDTMIIRTSDHGEMGLTHGGSRQKWFNVYQETIKVPMVWSNPVLFPKPVVSDALVTLMDTLPTIASFCGVKNLDRYDLQGYDYSPLFTNPARKVQDYTYFINTDVKAGQNIPQSAFPPNNIAMIRDARFKYAHYYGGKTLNGKTSKQVQEEFYNLATDVDPGTGEAVELENKSTWAQLQGAPWTVQPYEIKKRTEMKALLAKAMKDGVLATKPRNIPPVAMKPRANTVANAWGASVAATADVYQVICYSQHTYSYTLQILTGGVWSDVPSTTTLISTTLAGNNGPILFQAQPTLPSPPQYRVARTGPKGQITYEDVVWENYTTA
jgi:arylsulfatase A-like enzyme